MHVVQGRVTGGSVVIVSVLALATPGGAAPEVIRDRTPVESFAHNVAKGGRYEAGEVLITARSADDRARIERIAGAKDCKIVRSLGRRPLYLMRCPPQLEMAGLIHFLQEIDGVRWVEAGYYEEEEAQPDDLDSRQWYHANTGQIVDGRPGIEGADISSLEAWDITTGSRTRSILINDVGIYTQHVDLIDQIWVNEDEDCTNGVDDDNNGYVDDCRGYDFGDDDNDPDPSSLPLMQDDGDNCLRWHASMIAGLAGARGNNGQGITGINWDVSLMNVKKHRDSSCVSTTNRSIEAVLYAADNGADAVSMSFSSSNFNATFEQALQFAQTKGVVAVSSGGNGGRDNDRLTRYPNEYDVDASIVVGNSNHLDAVPAGANFGANTIDISAPGTNVMSTSIDSPFAFSFGTGSSYAAGFASGAVALTRSAFPMLDALEVTQAIKDGAQRVPTLDCAVTPRCVMLGARIDLMGALRKAAELAPAELSLQGVTVEEIGDGDGMIEAGETAFLRPQLDNSGRGGAFLVQAALTNPGGAALSLDRATTAVGHVPAGTTTDPADLAEPLVVTVPADCTEAFTAALTLTFVDRFDRTWSGTYDLAVACEPAPNPADGGTDGGDPMLDAAGCRTSPGAGLLGGWLLVGLAALIRRRR